MAIWVMDEEGVCEGRGRTRGLVKMGGRRLGGRGRGMLLSSGPRGSRGSDMLEDM